MSLLIELLILGGALFFLLSAVGLLRLPDTISRIHATSKGLSMGMGCFLIANALYFNSLRVWVGVILITTFIVLTIPIASLLLGSARVQQLEAEEKSRGDT